MPTQEQRQRIAATAEAKRQIRDYTDRARTQIASADECIGVLVSTVRDRGPRVDSEFANQMVCVIAAFHLLSVNLSALHLMVTGGDQANPERFYPDDGAVIAGAVESSNAAPSGASAPEGATDDHMRRAMDLYRRIVSGYFGDLYDSIRIPEGFDGVNMLCILRENGARCVARGTIAGLYSENMHGIRNVINRVLSAHTGTPSSSRDISDVFTNRVAMWMSNQNIVFGVNR